jgi:TetR/AcrR family transcriptional regulator, transcriptional repressor for nem operon
MIETPRTAKGRATRERIVATAAAAIREHGVAATSLEDVIERAGVSKSQLYLYFDSRAALIREVVAHNAELVLATQEPHLSSLETWKAIRAWLDALVGLQVTGGARGGCPIGSLVGQLAETDEQARVALADAFARWEEQLRRGLWSMQERGKLDRRADPARLATATLATIQGGLVLTQSRRDPHQLAVAAEAAYANLRIHAT